MKNILYPLFLIFLSTLALQTQSHAQCLHGTMPSTGMLYKTTGNAMLDSKMNTEQMLIQVTFGIMVDMYMFNDGHSPNALAYCQASNPFHDGTVTFGATLLTQELWNMSKGEYAVVGIMAHEFAHVLQCKKKCPLKRRDRELQADFMAGYYLGIKNYFFGNNIMAFAQSLFDKGDWYDPSHHGTPTERVAAMVAGFQSANLSTNQAYEKSLKKFRSHYSNTSTTSTPHSHSYNTYKTCGGCNGHGHKTQNVTCPTCYGYKQLTCRTCKGTGGYYYYGYPQTCGTCRGGGRLICSTCKGYGALQNQQKCGRCYGMGKVRK